MTPDDAHDLDLQFRPEECNHEFRAPHRRFCSVSKAAQKWRALACSKALEFLTSDNAHDLFTETFNFVQDSTFPEAACRTYKKSESSGAVTGMIQQSWE